MFVCVRMHRMPVCDMQTRVYVICFREIDDDCFLAVTYTDAQIF